MPKQPFEAILEVGEIGEKLSRRSDYLSTLLPQTETSQFYWPWLLTLNIRIRESSRQGAAL